MNALVVGRSLSEDCCALVFILKSYQSRAPMVVVGKLRNDDWMLISGDEVTDVNKPSDAYGGDFECWQSVESGNRKKKDLTKLTLSIYGPGYNIQATFK